MHTKIPDFPFFSQINSFFKIVSIIATRLLTDLFTWDKNNKNFPLWWGMTMELSSYQIPILATMCDLDAQSRLIVAHTTHTNNNPYLIHIHTISHRTVKNAHRQTYGRTNGHTDGRRDRHTQSDGPKIKQNWLTILLRTLHFIYKICYC